MKQSSRVGTQKTQEKQAIPPWTIATFQAETEGKRKQMKYKTTRKQLIRWY